MTPHEYVSPLRPENRVTGWKPCHEKRDGRQRPSGAGDGRGQPSRTHEGQEDARSSRALNLGGTTKALHGHQSLLFVPKLTRLGEKQVFCAWKPPHFCHFEAGGRRNLQHQLPQGEHFLLKTGVLRSFAPLRMTIVQKSFRYSVGRVLAPAADGRICRNRTACR